MSTLNEYFRTEAREFLNALERSLQRASGPNAVELHRAVRGLRGSAQMAREQRIVDVVSAFESVTRAIAGGDLTWSDNVADRARDTIADLRVLLDRSEDDAELDARVSDAAARWGDAGPDPAVPTGAPAADHGTREFREFAAREAAGIADALDRGVSDLQADPMDREPLTNILRRQRALLGSARLDEIPVIADILRAVEDLTRVIVKLDVGVKKEWLDIYRVARDGLQTTIAPLLRDELPETSHSVSRLRHMREELLERYGSTVEQPPPPADSLAPPTLSRPAAPFLSSTARAPAAVAPAPEAAAPDDVLDLGEASVVAEAEQDTLELGEDSVVDDDAGMLELEEGSVVAADATDGPADTLELDTPVYTREEALQRALELQDAIARVVAHDPQARAAVEELFDLIRAALE